MDYKNISNKLIIIVLIQLILIDAILITLFTNKMLKNSKDKEALDDKYVKVAVEEVEEKNFMEDIDEKLDLFSKTLSGFINLEKRPRDLKIDGLSQVLTQNFIATSYDLSYESCGKDPAHPAYGITFSGKKAQKGRTIAVDPKIIPLGSTVYIEFQDPYKHLTGWYKAEDTGRLVKGKIIDIYLGESAFYEMEKFGSRKVKIKVINP